MKRVGGGLDRSGDTVPIANEHIVAAVSNQSVAAVAPVQPVGEPVASETVCFEPANQIFYILDAIGSLVPMATFTCCEPLRTTVIVSGYLSLYSAVSEPVPPSS